ncbi:hypothetical protein VIBNISFn27_750056 [Vibrio nigripulchritudo SFn27]|uniref:Uncharacterized protein n=1 Tax=Vibrio nigripulchritudo TaxID=28173 RepID=U4KED9_9VIBR|nr:hypothetical protein VIBNIBLFn1_550088 [Vibrio nigripulchritudo BLFn1]CCN90693.1 hypothetical protein VIBNISFn27_750056 [Vibrio nigripulchritudo SFn27]CCN97280.1 hypothetical protein VIBNIENn2_920056 [Vibrio nigripulchritudo ENn2]CCO39916.1 hypothetical protein VIBNISFn135_200057 [Vibrio nigripulchritudo SFn135]CCO51056.1 hypothetical protein VIBNIWn13_1070056 [Vibrio nigripulchritudo Wn13]CCO61428.1 hypothetical protein VIBNI_B1695 [Vibrio nigripulchritudo]
MNIHRYTTFLAERCVLYSFKSHFIDFIDLISSQFFERELYFSNKLLHK